MSDDWYTRSIKCLKEDISLTSGVALADVNAVYSYLVNQGYIDYDTEKELLWRTYEEDEDDNETDEDT